MAFTANSTEPGRFACDAYLASSNITYADLITGIPDRRAWEAMEGDRFYAHARSYTNPVAISTNGQYFSGWHRRDDLRVDVRESATGALAHLFRLPAGYSIEEISPDGRRVTAVNLPLRARSPQYTHLKVIDTATGDVALDLKADAPSRDLFYAWISAEHLRVHLADGTRIYRFDGEGPARLVRRVPPASNASVLRFTVPTPSLTDFVRVSVRGFEPPALRVGEAWRAFEWRPAMPLDDGPRSRPVAANLKRPRYSVDFRMSPTGRLLALHGSHGFGDPVTGGNFESFVDVYDVPAARLIKRFFVPQRVVTSLAFSPDESELAWAGGNVLEVVNLASELKVFSDVRAGQALTALVTDLAFVDRNQLILYDGQARLRTTRIRP